MTVKHKLNTAFFTACRLWGRVSELIAISTGWRSTSSVRNLTKGKKTLLLCKYMFTLQRCFKNTRTSLEQVNKPSYEMVTKIQKTRLIRLNLTETHDQMFLYQSEFVSSGICDLKLQVIFSSIYLRYHWSWQGPITLTGAFDDSHCIFYLKVYYIQFSFFSSFLHLVPNKKTRRSVWSSYVRTWNAWLKSKVRLIFFKLFPVCNRSIL